MDRVLEFLLIGYIVSIACVVLVVLLLFLECGGPPPDPGLEVLRRQRPSKWSRAVEFIELLDEIFGVVYGISLPVVALFLLALCIDRSGPSVLGPEPRAETPARVGVHSTDGSRSDHCDLGAERSQHDTRPST